MNPPVHPAVEKLFHYSRGKAEGKRLLVPNDPGAGINFQTWNDIRDTGIIPGSDRHFEMTEVICSASWDPRPTKPGAPSYFLLRRYDFDRGGWVRDVPMLKIDYYDFRRFVLSVSLHLLNQRRIFSISQQVSPLVFWLLQNLPEDSRYLDLLREAFAATRDFLYAEKDPELPFFTFGELYLAQRVGDWEAASEKADQLIADEYVSRKISPNYSSIFLLSSIAQKDFPGWLRVASELANPHDHEETQLVMNEFSRWR